MTSHANRILEITTTTGNGNLLLGGAELGFYSFFASFGAGVTFGYVVENPVTGENEVGIGEILDSAGTYYLVRNSVERSSNANAKVVFAAGRKYVRQTLLATEATTFSNAILKDGSVAFTGDQSLGNNDLTNVLTINKVTITAPATSATLTLAQGSSLITAGANPITLTSTGSTGVTLPTTGTLATLAGAESLTNKKLGSLTSNGLVTTSGGDGTLSVTVPASGVLTFLATPSSANLISAVTDETGTGALVFATSPTLVTPLLGTPTSGTLTNCTGLPISTGVSGLGANVATFLATPSSANLATAVTDETGSGALVFADTATLTSTRINTALGINAVPPTTGLGKILQSATQTDIAANSYGYTMDFTHTSTGANAFSTVGARLQGFLTASGGNYTGQVAGANCNGGVTPAAGITCSQVVGNQALASNFGAGDLTEGNCFRTVGATNSGGGTYTTWVGYYASDSSAATNNYGFRGIVSSGSNKFNLYMSGTAGHYLNGNVGIGTVGVPSGAVLNLIQGGSATLGAATADTVSMANIDNGAGNRELQVQPESGGHFAWGANAYRVVPTANQDFYRKFPTVNTTNNTQTTLFTIPITASRTYVIEARVVARRTGGTAGTADDGASYVRRGTYTTKAGTVTLNTAVETIGTDREDQAAWDVTLSISSTNVLVRVTGDTDNNVTWFGDISIHSVGS